MVRLRHYLCHGIVLLLLSFPGIKSSEYETSVKSCVNRKSSVNFELPLEIVNDHGSLELWFRFNGKYDLYLTYNTGQVYHYELQLDEKISPRPGAERADCTNYLPAEANYYGCPFTVTEDENEITIKVESFLRVAIYTINKKTKEVSFSNGTRKYGTDLDGSTDSGQLDCVANAYRQNVSLPIEVYRKDNHVEIFVRYQGKYDFYNTIALGTVCGVQYQLTEKPVLTVEDYAHCTKCGSAAELYFYCPYKIQEDEDSFKIIIPAFFYDNIYTIDKRTNDVSYTKVLGRTLDEDPKKQFEKGITKCLNGLAATKFSLPIQIKRVGDFLEIWAKHNDTYDVFETYVSGSVCKHELQTSRDPSQSRTRHPSECFERGLDVPYYFICPYQILEDDDYVYFKVSTSQQYLYALRKKDGELVVRSFATYYDSFHQNTVPYLRNVVNDPKFY